MAETLIMPTLGLTMTEGTVDHWYKKVGDPVEKGEMIVSISSEKLTHDVESPIDGVLLDIVAPEGEVVPCKEAIGYVGEPGEKIESGANEKVVEKEADTPVEVEDKTEKSSLPKTEIAKRDAGERIFATPLARRIASEKGYELSEIIGTGGNGRITRRDVERHVPIPKHTAVGSEVVQTGEGLEGMRKVIAQRMHQSLRQTAQLTIHGKANVSELLAFRKEMKVKVGETLDRRTLSINTLLIKAVTLALKDYPEMNRWYDGQSLVEHQEVHMGVAVSVADGLIVPVLRDTHLKGLAQIGETFSDITSQALDGSLSGELYSGSTFTITNLGNTRVEYFTPILNTPEVGILGVGALQSKLIFNEDKEVVEIKELPLSLTFDHQVVDGAPAAEFLDKIIDYLEQPYLLVF
ncbi:dihydrolipoamide acetyltransferase family protein [Vagococcus elongatus]|uniref:Dihydrolipoamide acetyltransferase component of pyruvate dehydrogenase complex n=1 Tax=Vagococcus elongatus TaxID=180344 RepID=A0A430B5Z4_9ENTE|nr:dihydrolipoamide acetyltransferase family protein [Vagococcus elongatus]RSU15725.1 branched-chain alpha-keto acid dehydrogenase subunit E2 [Vagococcus elongatus]